MPPPHTSKRPSHTGRLGSFPGTGPDQHAKASDARPLLVGVPVWQRSPSPWAVRCLHPSGRRGFEPLAPASGPRAPVAARVAGGASRRLTGRSSRQPSVPRAGSRAVNGDLYPTPLRGRDRDVAGRFHVTTEICRLPFTPRRSDVNSSCVTAPGPGPGDQRRQLVMRNSSRPWAGRSTDIRIECSAE